MKIRESLGLNINVCGQVHLGRAYGFLVFKLQIAIGSFSLFHHSVLGYCFTDLFSLWCFTDEVKDFYADRILRVRFRASI